MKPTLVSNKTTHHAGGLPNTVPVPVDKTDLIRQVFQQCCQRMTPSSARAWIQLPTGTWSVMAQHGNFDPLSHAAPDSLSNCALQQVFEGRLPRQVAAASHGTAWNLPIIATGFQPIVFTLHWNTPCQPAEVPPPRWLTELSQQLSHSLQQHLQQARNALHAKWQRWRVTPDAPTAHPMPGDPRPDDPRPNDPRPNDPRPDVHRQGDPQPLPESAEQRVLQQLSSVTDSVNRMMTEDRVGKVDLFTNLIATADNPHINSTALIQLAECVGRQLDQQRVAYDVVNALQAYFGWGRISLCLLSGAQVKLSAISGIASFDSRSASVVAITQLVQRIIQSGQPLWHPEQEQDLPEEITQALNQYYETTDSRSIAVLPVVEYTDLPSDPNDLASAIRSEADRRGRKLAAIVIEGVRQPVHRQAAEGRWRAAERIVTQAIGNAQRHSRIPLLPVWKTLGDVKDLFQGHHRNKALAISLAGLVLLLVGGLVPYPLKLKAEGTIQPQLRSRVYAEVAGTIVDLPAVEGVVVGAGDPLIQLASPELEIEYARVQGEYFETRQAAVAIRDHLNSVHSLDEATLRSLRKERAGLEERLRSLQGQYELLTTKRNKLSIRSPQAGQVITWDLNQRLGRRPVQPGQHLLTVADASGPWELELIVPDRLTGYLRQSTPDKSRLELPVDFVLASDPRQVHRGALRQISESFQMDDQRGPVLRVYVDLGPEAADWLRQVKPGTEVMARIHTGNYPLGYCFFFEFFDWMKRQCFKYLG